ncbi:MAG TPA: LamG domain-containing protein [Polyangiaceae bacterium]
MTQLSSLYTAACATRLPRLLTALGAAAWLMNACGSNTARKVIPTSEAGAGGEGGELPSGGTSNVAGSGNKTGDGNEAGSANGAAAGAQPAAGEGGALGSEAGAGGAAPSEAGGASSGAGAAGAAALCSTNASCDPGYVCTNQHCVNVAGSLSGLLWQLPCTGPNDSVSCATTPTTTATTTLGLATGITYDVSLHFRGVVEQKTYTGGCRDGASWQSGGTDSGDTYNVYELSVSAPPQHFFLNVGSSSITHTFAIDFEKTIRVDAGATVTLYADSKDNLEIKNLDATSTPISITGTSVAQPFDGQFIQMDVDSVTPDAIASSAVSGGGTAGSALSFSGAQRATVADAALLHPASVTEEAWFEFAGATGSYNSLFGKTYGTGSADSYIIWFESGALHAGVGLNSPAGSAASPWNTLQEWHHAAFTYDAQSAIQTLYIDGSAVSCVTAGGAITYDNHDLLIGADVDNTLLQGFWNGNLDELRLFSSARTPDQIWADVHTHKLGATAGLIGEWTFDEGSGQTAADSSGNALDAILGSTTAVEASDPVWVTSSVPY